MPVRRIPYHSMLGMAALAATIACIPVMIEIAQAQTRDASSELRARVEMYEHVWSTHRASAVAAFFTEDADMILGNGPRIVGRAAIQDWWDAYFARIAATREGTFSINSLRLITADVAFINVDSKTAGRDSTGQELPTRLARGTWVLVRHSGDWWISALRGLPAEGDVRYGPGTDR